MSVLTGDQILFFQVNGYLVLPNFWSNETVLKLRLKMRTIVNGFDLSASRSIFSTSEQSRTTDDWFLTSGREIRYFWEALAFEKDGTTLREGLLLENSINKVGHGLHDLDEDFEFVSYERRVGAICRQLGIECPLAVQSMYIFKQAIVGGEVNEHQDGAFLYTEPQTCLGFWWALDECREDNGCLYAVPGSHIQGVNRRFRRKDVLNPSKGTEFYPTEPVRFDLTGAVPLLVSAGSLVLLHSAIVHYSGPNLSTSPRHGYSVHVVDGREGIVYPMDNWLVSFY